ncbi:MAG: cell division protein FtsA [Candidatus Midichloria sp.]|nr:cell division protein FtsA [Candidatus Midichloria sp.]
MIKQRKNVIAVLDIGSSKILCSIAKFSSSSELEVIGYSNYISEGIRSGIITNLQAATESIAQAIEEAEKNSGIRVSNIYVNISSNNLISHQLSAEIDVTGHEINSKDMNKLLFQVLDKYKDQQVSVIHSFIYDYVLDGNRGITNPLGMYGSNLSCEVNVLVTPNNIIANLANCLSKCQLDVNAYIASSYVSGVACLTPNEMKMGVVLIEIGSCCSSISIFANSQMIFTDGIPVGGHHITNDIAKGLSISYEDAERIKILYGTAISTSIESKENIELAAEDENEEPNLISRAILAEIIRARSEEILELLEHKIVHAGFSIASNKIVLTGGSANLNGLKELVGHMFSAKVRIGYSKLIMGLESEEKNMAFAVSVGMLAHISQTIKAAPMGKANEGSSSKKVWQWLKDNFI